MALLNYQNLDGEAPHKLLDEVFTGIKPFNDYLSRTKKFLESNEATLRLGWRAIKMERAASGKEDADGSCWVELVEPADRPDEPDGTFRSFLDENVRSVFEFEPPGDAAAQAKPTALERFGPAKELRVLDRDPRNNRLLLYRKPEGSSLLLRPNTDQIRKQLRALAHLRDMPAQEHLPLLRLFSRRDGVSWPASPEAPIEIQDWDVLTHVDRSGTEEQRRFVQIALNTPDFALLEGPPGSGKTTALCELILQLIRRGKRVLLCASTHVAVDNVLERLMDPDLKAASDLVLSIRIGDRSNVSDGARPRQLDEVIKTERKGIEGFLKQCHSPTGSQRMLRQAVREHEEFFKELVLSTANLVCGTTIGILQHPEFKKRQEMGAFAPQFDVLILDEASKTTFQEFLVPALLAKRWVVVGDYKQLSPYVDEEAMAVNIAACLPDPKRRQECLAAFRAKAAPSSLDSGSTKEDRWEAEVAWRLTRLHELRFSKGETNQKLEADIKALLPQDCAEVVWQAVDLVRRVALPSVLECLLYGFDKAGAERHRTTLTNGFFPGERDMRHVLLTYQHRMHPEIAAYSREHIYAGKALQDAVGMADKRADFGYSQNNPRAVWLRVAGQPIRGNKNPDEAEVVVSEVRRLAEWARQNPRREGGAWEVAVLTFYRGQERELRGQFRTATGQHGAHRYFEFGPHLKVELCTVDRFQGHEADIVFISFANTRSTNFLESPNRLNVALTRARYYRVIVGHQIGLARSRGDVLRKLAETEKWEARVITRRPALHHVRPNSPPPAPRKAPTKSRNDFGSNIEIDITELHSDKVRQPGRKGKR